METGANVTYHPVINFEGNYIMLDCFNPAHFKTYECFRVSCALRWLVGAVPCCHHPRCPVAPLTRSPPRLLDFLPSSSKFFTMWQP